MAKWLIKEFAKLTDVSVKTLHHYDSIDLLKPSLRSESGYRIYSEKDLLVLQQITALKFFGFKLAEIKALLQNEADMLQHFAEQSSLLKEKAQALIKASETLDELVSDCKHDKPIPWQTLIKSLEVFKMAQNLQNPWVANVLTPEELQEYASFEKELKNRFSEAEATQRKAYWNDLVQELQAHLSEHPESEAALKIAKQCIDWTNELYGKKHANLKNALWERGFLEGKTENAHGLSKEAALWLDKAISAYWKNRCYMVFKTIGVKDDAMVANTWHELLEEISHGDQAVKQQVLAYAMDDKGLNQTTKDWLKKHSQI